MLECFSHQCLDGYMPNGQRIEDIPGTELQESGKGHRACMAPRKKEISLVCA